MRAQQRHPPQRTQQPVTALGCASRKSEAGALEDSLAIKRNLRALFLGLILHMGSLFGMPMRPEEIEELTHAMNQDRVCQVVREEHDDAGTPPSI
jgi:hypothetical protein